MSGYIPSIALFLTLTITAPLVSAETVRVSTRENTVRTDCRFLSPVKSRVRYGDELEVVSKQGDWLRVSFNNTRGCIHRNAVTDRQISLSPVSAKGSAASGGEVALAGKGFNPDVERSYQSKHPELDYNAVNSIEAFSVSDETLTGFIGDGGLNQP